jgi:hypothetical protein
LLVDDWEGWDPVKCICGLRLVFRNIGGYVQVSDAETGMWVANVFLFHRANGALVRPSYTYRAQLGRDDRDQHGIKNRRAIAEFATTFFKDG